MSGPDVATPRDGVARNCVGDAVAVEDAVLLGTSFWLTVGSTSKKPGLDRSGSDAANSPWPVGGLKRRTYRVLLASSAAGGSEVTSLRFPSWPRFTDPLLTALVNLYSQKRGFVVFPSFPEDLLARHSATGSGSTSQLVSQRS